MIPTYYFGALFKGNRIRGDIINNHGTKAATNHAADLPAPQDDEYGSSIKFFTGRCSGTSIL
jgi:hypothetical protein